MYLVIILGTQSQNNKLADSGMKKDDHQCNNNEIVEEMQTEHYNEVVELQSTASILLEGQDPEEMIVDSTKVATELKRFFCDFTSLVRRIISHLEEMIKTSKCKLTDIARHIGLFLSEEIELDKLTEVTTIDKLFDKIKHHYCFLNCTLIESIVNKFLCGDVLQTELKQYLEELDSFEKSAELQDIKTAIEEALLPKQEATETTCKVIIKSTKRWEKMTIKNFKKLFFYLFGEVVYAHIMILPGSIFLEFLVPRSQIQSLVLIAAEKVELMYQVGIFEMIVDGKLIFKKEEDTTITFEQSLLQAAQTGHITMMPHYYWS